MQETGNVFSGLPDASESEKCEIIVSGRSTRIERIVSRGQASPADFWYDQAGPEWVMVLKGRGAIRFEGRGEPLELGPGDWTHIPAHVRHRVEWTAPDEETVWLAVFHEDAVPV